MVVLLKNVYICTDSILLIINKLILNASIFFQDKLITPNHHGYGSTTGNGGITYSTDSHIVDMTKSFDSGSTVSFHDINYTVETKIDGNKATKVILKDIK